ncbi:hypothetical protein DSM112329_04768 [Paraconexibacter sp. AEG42_29]|uniref:Uncharacterized protein n=1 Tax=Paraconexibacter sp. AEG42_29 TaxID=2997339 RepID=A0AAU7B1Y7_9ACTN
MSVDEQYSAFVATHRAEGDADPRPFLAKVGGLDRAELAARIDRFLETVPVRTFDSEAFARFRADPARQQLVDDALSTVTLKELRAGTSKRTVANALAARLGLGDHQDAVRARYHDIETGTVDPARVKQSVWEALSESLGATVDRVRSAADAAFAGSAGGRGGVAAFARMEPGTGFGSQAVPVVGGALAGASDGGRDAVVDAAFFE